MKLIFLHGPPASGKFTIAEELVAQFGWKNFHNHLTIDVAKALFEFGTDPFWELVCELRNSSLKTAAKHGLEVVIFTCCYSDPEDRPSRP